MKKIGIFIGLLLAVSACEPRGIENISVGIVWKAQTVKENGQLVYQAGNANNIRPGYERFRIDLTSKESALYTDIDGRKLTGTWEISSGNKSLMLSNLVPAPSETGGIIEFFVIDLITKRNLHLKRTSESRKTGQTINEYQLVPE